MDTVDNMPTLPFNFIFFIILDALVNLSYHAVIYVNLHLTKSRLHLLHLIRKRTKY